tara:strand:+ start:380 stop:697 length:318 start_codon:yes stop_codon:yes gene_type:complete
MPRYHNINGKSIQFTAEEETARDAEEKAWADEKPTRQIYEIRKIRNKKLAETDFLALSDNIISDEMKQFRKTMRDIPQDYDSSKYDELLARNDKGELTHSVWSKP